MGNEVPTTFNRANGIYEGWAQVKIPTVSVVPGTNIVTNCSVTLTQSLNCTTTDNYRTVNVSQEAITNCNTALTHRSTEDIISKVVGK